MSGTVGPAERGELVAFLGARVGDLPKIEPVLALLCKRVLHVGDVGQGQAMKVVLNSLGTHHFVAFASMLALGERAGLRRDTIVDAFTTGAFASPSYVGKKPKVLVRDYSPEFTLALALKDAKLGEALGAEVGIDLPVMRDLVREESSRASEQAWAERISSRSRRPTRDSSLAGRRNALVLFLFLSALLALPGLLLRRFADVERALAEDDLHLAVGRRKLHLERLGADDGVVLHGARELHDVGVELAGDLSLRVELADLHLAVHGAVGLTSATAPRGRPRSRPRTSIGAVRRERSLELGALLDQGLLCAPFIAASRPPVRSLIILLGLIFMRSLHPGSNAKRVLSGGCSTAPTSEPPRRHDELRRRRRCRGSRARRTCRGW